ncbi:hypothetical protein [Burkholderia vietnamiensis]|uniref:hypothetical protein n=1 Tax=Burkholderia vietnamiensis TaxID=60552 RepID=UPI0015945EBE|nr:hypothetical protein [Burkholderia vietnamiensis]MCA8198481.1 hypothetical protein [Burkholderia vietnamiensis]MCA8228328.1 hypothetical protein [Burkholderia vietnamiensis]
MRITKQVDVEVEVEVDISVADVVSELPVSAENLQEVLRGFNSLLSFARALPDELLTSLSGKQREIIRASLTQLNSRLASLPLPDEVHV